MRRAEGGEVTIELEDGTEVKVDELAVAAGRHPRTDDLGLETVGLEPGQWIDVDDQLRVTGVEGNWLYAIGDVNARALLTHVSKYQARVAADNILGKSAAAIADGARSPRVLFTDPQVAAVGHTLQSAQDAGLNVKTVEAGTSANAGGNFYGRGAVGTTRLVIDSDRDVIVGATITGSEIADFLHAATIAIVGEVPLERVAHAIPVVPDAQRSLVRSDGAAGLLMEQLTTVTAVDELGERELAAFPLTGKRIAIAKVDDAFYAFGDICTHQGCSLAEGELDGTTVTCPCHGSEFDVTTGEVLRGPAREPVRSYPVRVEDGLLRVEV